MWHLGTWFSGGLGSGRFTVGLDDLKGLFQPKQFYDSIWDVEHAHPPFPAVNDYNPFYISSLHCLRPLGPGNQISQHKNDEALVSMTKNYFYLQE